jgi:hypothetical protein
VRALAELTNKVVVSPRRPEIIVPNAIFVYWMNLVIFFFHFEVVSRNANCRFILLDFRDNYVFREIEKKSFVVQKSRTVFWFFIFFYSGITLKYRKQKKLSKTIRNKIVVASYFPHLYISNNQNWFLNILPKIYYK